MTRDPPPAGTSETRAPPAIVDLVALIFGAEPAGARRRWTLGGALVVLVYATLFGLAQRRARHAGSPRPAAAARPQHSPPLASERFVDLPPPLPARRAAAAPRTETAPARPVVPRAARASHAPVSRAPSAASPSPVPSLAPAPAQAAPLAAVSPAPADAAEPAFVTGAGASFAGGATSGGGTARAPAPDTAPGGGPGAGLRVAQAAPAGLPNRARAVSLDGSEWNCPWPAEADAEGIDEQTVVLRAQVRADGTVADVEVLVDPGLGFGVAARLCASRTRFAPARDRSGREIAAASPPIRVHFFR